MAASPSHRYPSAASAFATASVSVAALDHLAEVLPAETLGVAIRWAASDTAARQAAAQIMTATGRIHYLVSAVKGFTFMDRDGVPDDIDIARSLAATVAMLESKSRAKSLQVRIEAANDLPTVHGVGSELNQVWEKLIDNAIDAAPMEGNVTVNATAGDAFVVVSVMDDGPGIPDEHRARIFDPFFTTKPVGAGTASDSTSRVALPTSTMPISTSRRSPDAPCFVCDCRSRRTRARRTSHHSTLTLRRMQQDTDVAAVAHVIQLAVAPVFLLSGIGAMLSVMTTRMARVVDRARVLEREAALSEREPGPAIVAELSALSRRATLISHSITLCTTTALLICAVIAILFFGASIHINTSAAVAFLFITAMVVFFAGLVMFLREIRLAAATVRIGISHVTVRRPGE